MIAITDYGVGNLFSVEKAFLALGADARITSDAEMVMAAEKVVLPGVGAFGDCMKNLRNSGLDAAVIARIRDGAPVLGICVGLQALFEGSEESPGAKGLGIIKGYVRKIRAPGLKIPHMGWNSLKFPAKRHPLFRGIPEGAYVYFVHSYYAVPKDGKTLTASAEYGEMITAAVALGNVMATQFHPEKSGDVGLQILENFVRM